MVPYPRESLDRNQANHFLGRFIEHVYTAERLQTSIRQTPQVDARLDVFTAVTMKNTVFWDIGPYGSCKTDV
jgi:hypothetical protein